MSALDVHDDLESAAGLRTAQLTHLARHLIEVAENEKSALASLLHDELGSHLTAVNLDVTSVAMRLKDQHPALAEKLERSLRLLHESVDITRRMIHRLRPSMLDSLGPTAAVRLLAEDFTQRTAVTCIADCAEDLPELNIACAIALCRVAEEALENVSRHAGASKVRVKLQATGSGIALSIVDDGVGIDAQSLKAPSSHGLHCMHERLAAVGGELTVRAGADKGTVIEAFVPLECATPKVS